MVQNAAWFKQIILYFKDITDSCILFLEQLSKNTAFWECHTKNFQGRHQQTFDSWIYFNFLCDKKSGVFGPKANI